MKFIHLRLEHGYIGKESYKIKVYKCSHRQARPMILKNWKKKTNFVKTQTMIILLWRITGFIFIPNHCIAPNNYSNPSSKIE